MFKRKNIVGCENCESSRTQFKKREYEWLVKERNYQEQIATLQKQLEINCISDTHNITTPTNQPFGNSHQPTYIV